MTSTSAIVTAVTLRYSDMDAQGHLNNAVYATLCEAGRVDYVAQRLADAVPDGAGFVIVRLAIDFRAEGRYPGTAEVETAVARVGNSSLTFRQRITLDEALVAQGEGVCVLFDLQRRRALPLTPALRERLGAALPEGGAG